MKIDKFGKNYIEINGKFIMYGFLEDVLIYAPHEFEVEDKTPAVKLSFL